MKKSFNFFLSKPMSRCLVQKCIHHFASRLVEEEGPAADPVPSGICLPPPVPTGQPLRAS